MQAREFLVLYNVKNKSYEDSSGNQIKNEVKVDEEEFDFDENKCDQEEPKWVHSLENFWDKALSSKFPEICIIYSDKELDSECDEVYNVECSIGRLMVEGTGDTMELAKENAAQVMFSLIEDILEKEGTETLKKNIMEEDSDVSIQSVEPPFIDEMAVEDTDGDFAEEMYEDEYDTTKEVISDEEEDIGSSIDEPQEVVSGEKAF